MKSQAEVSQIAAIEPEGAKAYQRDWPKAELRLLDTGHFEMEEYGDAIPAQIVRFLSKL